MLPAGLESTIAASERPQTQAFDRAVTGTDSLLIVTIISNTRISSLRKIHRCVDVTVRSVCSYRCDLRAIMCCTFGVASGRPELSWVELEASVLVLDRSKTAHLLWPHQRYSNPHSSASLCVGRQTTFCCLLSYLRIKMCLRLVKQDTITLRGEWMCGYCECAVTVDVHLLWMCIYCGYAVNVDVQLLWMCDYCGCAVTVDVQYSFFNVALATEEW